MYDTSEFGEEKIQTGACVMMGLLICKLHTSAVGVDIPPYDVDYYGVQTILPLYLWNKAVHGMEVHNKH